MKYQLISLFLITIFSGCRDSTIEPKELYEKYKSSVVLIKNDYFFSVHLDNDLHFFYTVSNEGKPTIHDNENDAIQHASTCYGTGFFISDKGEIATNRHVIYPEKADKEIGELINKYLADLKTELEQAINDNVVQNQKIEAFYDKYYSTLEYNQISDLKDAYLQKKNKIVELQASLSTLNFDPKKTRIEMITTSLGIAFDDTHVTASNDFISCVPIKKSSIEDIDLAIIQLKDKTTPSKIKNYFDISKLKSVHKLALNDKVYMIGFNYGIALAQTSEGVKSQLTSGEISQDPDSKRVLYSIPTLAGSSGSPVINVYGELVSINFAKVSGEQNFGFGIPANYLVNLYASSIADAEPDHLIVADINNKKPDNTLKSEYTNNSYTELSTDYSSIIREFISAEDANDFEKIYGYFSSNLKRYYDLNNPSYSDLKKRYEYLWDVSSERKNNINRIDKLSDSVYDLYTSFSYYSNKQQRTISQLSKVRFVFDNEGKIIETY